MRIFVTGGTGLIGSLLVRRLRQRGDQVAVLTRRPEAAAKLGLDCELVAGDPTEAGSWQEIAARCDAIINLAGEGIFGKRWTPEFKTLLRDSRVKATSNCVAAISKEAKRADSSPKLLLNASAIGFYGPHGDEELDESSPPGNDFLAGVCVDWENAARPAAEAGARLVLARTGVVLDKQGGALKQLLRPFKLGAGGPVASGKQVLSWIHHVDEIEMLLFALDQPQASGPMNVTAPHPRTNKEFGKALGRALGRPAFMWTPGFMLRLMLGEAADMVTTGQRVLPRKALQWGYTFKFPDLDAALADILK
jgi:uncharacterized protein (TIGR01777 family)